MKKLISVLVKIILCVVIVGVLFWFLLPPINLRSGGFWFFVAVSFTLCTLVCSFADFIAFLKGRGGVHITQTKDGKVRYSGQFVPFLGMKIIGFAIGGLIVLSVLASIVGMPIFHAKSYHELITYETGDFAEDVAEIDRNAIPVVDRDTATRLGLRKLGEMSDLVSQFEVDDSLYTQINYKNTPYRVTPLIYGDPIKWLYNQKEGIPAYITVNMVTQETALVRLDEGIRYSESEYFFRNINRHLRFSYPTKIFDSISFEIDEDGTPFWVAPTVQYRIGLWNGRDIGGAVLVNAVTGESHYYDASSVPSWVDQVCTADLVIEQLNFNGKYVQGFWNATFGQRSVLQTTEGYNYLAIGDDVYLYTGMTSVSGDESNVGFVLVNLRTKETKFYAVPGAEEYSAMDSAKGQVQHLAYSATFPILLNVYERPTYFMSLKDSAGLVKMYAFVDVQQYQIVGTGSSVDEARENYIARLSAEGELPEPEEVPQETKTAEGVVSSVQSAVVGGETQYYFMLEGDEAVYIAPVSIHSRLPFLTAGARVTLKILKTEENAEEAYRVHELTIEELFGDNDTAASSELQAG